MEKKPRRLVLGATPIICFILFPMLYAEYLTSNASAFNKWMQQLSNWNVYHSSNTTVANKEIVEQISLEGIKHLSNWNANISNTTVSNEEVEEKVSLEENQNMSDWSSNSNTTVSNEEIEEMISLEEIKPLTNLSFDSNKETEEQNSLESIMGRLVRGEDRIMLEETGFACDSAAHSLVCVANKPVRIDAKNMKVYIPSHDQNMTRIQRVVRPYARQEDEDLLKYVTPVEMIHGNITAPSCQYTHDVPALIFSSKGFTGNLFHEFNEIIIPLFLTAHSFQSRLQFIIIDYKPYFVNKYSSILSNLSPYEVINPAENSSVHCFPGTVVGLKFHDHLALNSSDIPGGYSMPDFKSFLREVYNLKFKHVREIEKPVLMFISRPHSRSFLNEKQMVVLMEELGFKVIIIRRPKRMSKLENFARVVNSCKVIVGAHGAGITNELFLPDGAVTIQVVPLGLQWASTKYFGEPAEAMGIHYLEYTIQPEESSLFNLYGKDHPVITDPMSIFDKGYQVAREVYVETQNLHINVERFRETLVEAFEIIQTTSA